MGEKNLIKLELSWLYLREMLHTALIALLLPDVDALLGVIPLGTQTNALTIRPKTVKAMNALSNTKALQV